MSCVILKSHNLLFLLNITASTAYTVPLIRLRVFFPPF
uniref:Uncharacterized protein n=1 Tax=Anguilla anguilla TaxID=7936 RepID=A0A0E9T1D7_ANGAN